MRILFTGATGFVGSHIRNFVETANNDILYVVAPGERIALRSGRSKAIEADLKNILNAGDEIIPFDPEVCIHCAWQGIPDYGEELSKINLRNSVGLVDFLSESTACNKLVVSGTCLEYGKTEGACGETETGKPASFFAWAKAALYNYANLKFHNSGRSLIWFRIFYVYGPGQRKASLIPSLVSSLRNGELPRIGTPYNANDFIFVEDVAEAFNVAVCNVLPSGIYNLGSGISTKVIDICEIVERVVAGHCRMTDLLRKNITTGQTSNFWADTNKSRKVLGWESRTNIEKGIKHYYQSEVERNV